MKIDYTTFTEAPGIKALQEQLDWLYHRGLADMENLQLPSSPHSDKRFFDAYQNYVVRSKKRDKPVAHLNESGIEILVSWPKPCLELFSLPMTEKVSDEVLSLPMYPELSDENAAFMIDAIHEFHKG
jgi:dTDP-4-amino-4,6-dideoxygalactose transaminase